MTFREDELRYQTPFCSELCSLGIKHRTDKSMHNRTASLNYLDVYEVYLGRLRNEPIRVLEIGVRDGASLRMWEEYFPQARIFGLDIDPDCVRQQTERVCVEIGDQADPGVIERIGRGAGPFHLIVDDGSHLNRDIIRTFEGLWPWLAAGGVYIIEDLYHSYGPREKPTKCNRRSELAHLFEQIIGQVDDPARDALAIHFWDSICIVLKV